MNVKHTRYSQLKGVVGSLVSCQVILGPHDSEDVISDYAEGRSEGRLVQGGPPVVYDWMYLGGGIVRIVFRNVADNGAAGREWLEFCKG